MQHLDGDIPVEVVVVCFPHFAHPAFADALEESIAAEDGTGLNGQAAGGGIARASGHGFVSGKASYLLPRSNAKIFIERDCPAGATRPTRALVA